MYETNLLRENGARAVSAKETSKSIDFTVDAEKRLVTVKIGTKLTAQSIARYARQLKTHPVFEPSFSEIVDLRDTEEISLEGPDFMKLADEIDPFSLESKRAFLVRTSTQGHAARMHQILRGKKKIEIFRLMSDALDWVKS